MRSGTLCPPPFVDKPERLVVDDTCLARRERYVLDKSGSPH